MCKNFMVIKHSIKELLAKSMVTRPMKCIVGYYIGGLNRPISSLEFNQVLKLNGNIYHYSLYIYIYLFCRFFIDNYSTQTIR